MKPIVTDTYDFPTLIEGGYVYVDKTALLRRMISGVDGRFFFMSRPRRFGKSLMISTLEQIFRGNKKLFKGLEISKSDYNWKKYPVIRLDMSQVRATDANGYRRALCGLVTRLAKANGIDLSGEDNPGTALGILLEEIAGHLGQVVVLIDEYDAPIGGLLGQPELIESVRTLLHDFYLMLKVRAADIHFLMMTGVSKFTKLSVFSGMNNLTDLSMSPIYASLLGYTRAEVECVFKPHVKAFARELKKRPEAVVRDLLDWYDSYRFSPQSDVRVCNPVSVGRALQEHRFYGFWDATGSATLIVERLRKLGKLPEEIEGIKVFPKKLDVCDVKTLPFAALMYQGGYLTIKDVDSSGELILGIPNREVRLAIYDGFVESLLQDNSDSFTSQAVDLKRRLNENNAGEVLPRILQTVFAMVPHEWKLKSEAEAKRYFLLFMRMAGATINAEVESANGRADAILETDKAVFVFEFKYGTSAKAALKQCLDRKYAAPYADDKRRIILVGVNYDPKMSCIETIIGEVNGEVKSKSGEVNGEVKSYIAEHPGCRRKDVLSVLSIAPRTLDRQLARLMERQEIEFRGAPKNGGYYVRDEGEGMRTKG